MALLPLPASEATVASVDHGGSGYNVVIRLVGETDEVEIQTRWKDRDGRPTIVEASHLSKTAREAAAAEEEAEAEAERRRADRPARRSLSSDLTTGRTMADSKPFLPPRWFIRGAWAAHRAIYRLSGGRMGLGPPTAKTYGTLRIHTVGRRTGEHRIAILGYFEDGPNLYTLAMNGWGEPEPAWWLNLQAHPEARSTSRTAHATITAREATGEERARLWSAMRDHEPISTPTHRAGRSGPRWSCSNPRS